MDPQVIESSLPLVRAIAAKYVKRCPAHVDLDDYVQEGAIGLLQAAERFDATKGVAFRTFAAHRVRGAILDAARSRTRTGYLLSRQQRAKAGNTDPMVEQLSAYAADQTTARSSACPMEASWLRARMASLPARDRYIINAYYFVGLTEKEIGPRVRLSETGVNYARRMALARMAA